jgi:hypothetical protein
VALTVGAREKLFSPPPPVFYLALPLSSALWFPGSSFLQRSFFLRFLSHPPPPPPRFTIFGEQHPRNPSPGPHLSVKARANWGVRARPARPRYLIFLQAWQLLVSFPSVVWALGVFFFFFFFSVKVVPWDLETCKIESLLPGQTLYHTNLTTLALPVGSLM